MSRRDPNLDDFTRLLRRLLAGDVDDEAVERAEKLLERHIRGRRRRGRPSALERLRDRRRRGEL